MVAITQNQHDAFKFETNVSRTIDARREDVFAAFTTIDQVEKWWGPKDFTVPEGQLDFRTGGAFRICIRSPKGEDMWQHGAFRETDEPSRISFTFAWEGLGLPQEEGMVTILLEEDEHNKTRVSLRHSALPSQEEADSHQSGWGECLDRLAEFVGRKTQPLNIDNPPS